MAVHVGGRGPGHLARVMGAFSLAAFMAQQTDGFWYDLTKGDRLFQEEVGPTPANDPGEVIGLALSQRLWNGADLAGYLAGQTELCPNTSFETAASCTLTQGNATLSATGGRLRLTSTDTFSSRWSMPVACVVGRTYCLIAKRYGSGRPATGVSVSSAANLSSAVAFATSAPLDGTVTLYFTATATTMYVGGEQSTPASSGLVSEWDDFSVKEVSRQSARQATTSFKPKFQTDGAEGDGADDRLATNYAAGSGENFVIIPGATIAASLSGTQVLCGAQDGSSNGAWLGITSGGALRARMGSTSVDSTGIDLRGGVHDIGFWTDGGTLYLFANGAIVGSGAWTGTIPTTAWNLFGLNNNGTASNFFAGKMLAVLAGRDTINLARANQICAAY